MTAKHRALYCNFQQQLVFSLNEETFISKLKQAQTSWNQAARLFLTMWIIDCKLVFQQVMAVLKHSRVGATGYRTQTQMPNCSIADWTDNKAQVLAHYLGTTEQNLYLVDFWSEKQYIQPLQQRNISKCGFLQMFLHCYVRNRTNMYLQ